MPGHFRTICIKGLTFWNILLCLYYGTLIKASLEILQNKISDGFPICTKAMEFEGDCSIALIFLTSSDISFYGKKGFAMAFLVVFFTFSFSLNVRLNVLGKWLKMIPNKGRNIFYVKSRV